MFILVIHKYSIYALRWRSVVEKRLAHISINPNFHAHNDLWMQFDCLDFHGVYS